MTQPPLTSPLHIAHVEVPNRILLAPLAGIGNWFVRLQARRYGAGRTEEELAAALDLSLNELRFFSVHRENERVTHYVTFTLPNSRLHEQEADRICVELAARAGYDPRAAVSVWQKMAEA